jgi:hypothetical protein
VTKTGSDKTVGDEKMRQQRFGVLQFLPWMQATKKVSQESRHQQPPHEQSSKFEQITDKPLSPSHVPTTLNRVLSRKRDSLGDIWNKTVEPVAPFG